MILVTGGCGYVGSHAVVKLISIGYDVVILDNFSNSKKIIFDCMSKISDRKIYFIKGDIRDKTLLKKIFTSYKIDCVFHFAGSKSISESIKNPIKYYSNNVSGSISLFETMEEFKVFNLIFSSSATIYNHDNALPWNETDETNYFKHPYAESKIIIEGLLKNLIKINKKWRIAILRYFNPVGAHISGCLGEFSIHGSTNLFPNIIKTYLGYTKSLSVYGNKFKTNDGTGVRDYIHIYDLIIGHIMAYEFLLDNDGLNVWNLGSGRGFSVLEVIKKCEEVLNTKINFIVADQREGDLAEYWADISNSKNKLGWYPKKNLDNMIEDPFRFINISKKYLF